MFCKAHNRPTGGPARTIPADGRPQAATYLATMARVRHRGRHRRPAAGAAVRVRSSRLGTSSSPSHRGRAGARPRSGPRRRSRPGVSTLRYAPQPGVGGEQLEPALLAHPAPEGGAGNARGGHLQLQIGPDAPAFTDPGLVDVDAAGGQVLPEEAVRQFAAQAARPTGRGPRAGRRTRPGRCPRGACRRRCSHRPVRCPTRTASGPGSRTSTGPSTGCLPIPVDFDLLVRVGPRPSDVDRVEDGHRLRLRGRSA